MKTKLKIIIPTIIAIAAVIIAALCIKFTPNETADLDSLISTAQKYLTEQKYEQAIAEFEKAIELDPMNVDAYIGIAQAYEGLGDIGKAIEWLEKGFELTGDERLKTMLEPEGGMIAETTTDTVNEATGTTQSSDTDITTSINSESGSESDVNSEETEAETVRAEAMDIMDMFNVYKETGEPNSVVYYYRKEVSNVVEGGWHTGSVCKCTYDETGSLSQSVANLYYEDTKQVSSELEVNDWQNNSGILYNNRGEKYYKYISNTVYLNHNIIGNIGSLDFSEFSFKNDNCYLFDNIYNDIQVKIYISEDKKVKKITYENEYSSVEYYQNAESWICTYVAKNIEDYTVTYDPCVQYLPEGCTESDFNIPENPDSYKTFTSWEEYRDYGLSLS